LAHPSFTAHVTGSIARLARDGSVMFKDGSTVLGSGTVDGSAMRVLVVFAVDRGHTIGLFTSGDSTFNNRLVARSLKRSRPSARARRFSSSLNPSNFGDSFISPPRRRDVVHDESADRHRLPSWTDQPSWARARWMPMARDVEHLIARSWIIRSRLFILAIRRLVHHFAGAHTNG